jgi:peroxiredoxin Q/BCP
MEVLMLQEGTKAPDFRALDHAGCEVNLADYAGKNLVLWFYPKADTPG